MLLSIEGVASLGNAKKQVALHFAARYGTAEMVECCCAQTPDPNILDGQHKTPLLWAAEAGNLEGLKVLLQHKANPNLTDYKGDNLLHLAVKEQHITMVQWIVENLDHALIKQKDKHGQTPLDIANQTGDDRLIAFFRNQGSTS